MQSGKSPIPPPSFEYHQRKAGRARQEERWLGKHMRRVLVRLMLFPIDDPGENTLSPFYRNRPYSLRTIEQIRDAVNKYQEALDSTSFPARLYDGRGGVSAETVKRDIKEIKKERTKYGT